MQDARHGGYAAYIIYLYYELWMYDKNVDKYTFPWMICKRRDCKNEKFWKCYMYCYMHIDAEFKFDAIWIPRDWNVSYFAPNPNSVSYMWEMNTGAGDIRCILYGKPKYDTCLELENNVDTGEKV